MKYNIYIVYFFNILFSIEEECENWNSKYKCQSNDNFEIPSSWDERGFQTPPRNDIYNRYRPSYQDMHYLVGYAQLKYSKNKKICTIKFITRVNPKLGIEGKDYYILYNFGDIEQNNNTIILNAENDKYPDGMLISAKIIDIRTTVQIVKLELEKEYFLWDNPQINLSSKYENGQKGGIVEFFGWPYEDILLECEFLSHAGYMGLKVYSPNEQLISYNYIEDGMLNPWWYMTQVVSYKFSSRAGNKTQLKQLINTCRSLNLRIYADININSMTGHGMDRYDDHINYNEETKSCDHWGSRESTGGSPFWTVGFRYENNPYTGLEPGLEYPAVPYFPSDFHCDYTINNYFDANDLNGGWVSGLADLNTEKEFVQQRIVDFYIELLSIGFSGFSLQNAKHIYPSTHAILFQKLKIGLGNEFPEDFIAVIQLTYGWEKGILMCEEDKRSSFGIYFERKLKENNLTDDDIKKIKIWNSGFPNETPKCDDNIWRVSPERHTLSVENYNDINLDAYYKVYIRDKNIEDHRYLTVNMFINHEYNWKIKSIFSTFSLINDSKGLPDGKSDCSKCKGETCQYCTKSFPYQKAYDPLSIGYDTGNSQNWKEGTYTRVHRDFQIINSMRQWMNLTLFTTEDELYKYERIRANCSEECLICNDESKMKNMCLICNKSKGFYPLIYPGYSQKYFKCLNSSIKYQRFYFNETEESFKPCFETCRECDREGTPENHNCLKCDIDLIERPGITSNLKNCVVNCSFKYNITEYGQYKCVEMLKCAKKGLYYIREKNICIDKCKNDDNYKYGYKGICLVSCPINTLEKDFLCLEEEETDRLSDESSELNTLVNIETILSDIENNPTDKESIKFDTEKIVLDTVDILTDEESNKNHKEYIESDNIIETFKSDFINSNVCTISEKEVSFINFQENEGGINDIIKNYKDKYYYTNKHILQLNNKNYNIIIYKDTDCIEELSINVPKIDFGECYNKALSKTNQTNNLIIVYAENRQTKNPNSTYSLYDPITADKIDGKTICSQDIIILEKNISFFFQNKNKNFELMQYLIDLGVDIFNPKDPFFQDICYRLESPLKKDITLKDRILSFYPDIQLCDAGCEYKGVNFTSMSCSCLCVFNDIVNNDLIKDNIFIEENINDIIDILSNSNLEVLKCYKYIFKYMDKSIGGFIILISFLNCITFTIIFYLKDMSKLENYIIKITEKYLNCILIKENIDIKGGGILAKDKNLLILNEKETDSKKKRSIKNIPHNKKELPPIKKKDFSSTIKNESISINKIELNSKDSILNKKDISQNNKINGENTKKKSKNDIDKEFFDDYLTTSIEDLDFEDTMRKDHRSFFEYLCDSIVDNQIIINTFYSSEPLRPITLKIILFNINIVIYFIVNGLFYSEDYISEIYHTENEKFFSFIPRSINRFVYSTLVSIVISFLIDCFFIEEKKIKGIFLREKDDRIILKTEIVRLIKELESRYFSLILIVFIILIISLYYLLCFNYVYPHMQEEWIKSSIIIMIILQVLSILTCFLESVLRFISFYYKSERIYKLSKLIN